MRLFPCDSAISKTDHPVGLTLQSAIRHQPIDTLFTRQFGTTVAIGTAHAILNGRLRLTDLDLVVFGPRSTSCRQAGPQRRGKDDADSEPNDGAPIPPQYSHDQQAIAGSACAHVRSLVSIESAQLCFRLAARRHGTANRGHDPRTFRPTRQS